MRLRPRDAIALATFVAVSLSPALADEPSIAPFTLAIVRQDAIVVPFATWNGKEWSNTWPVPEKEVDTPISMAEVPKRWWGKAAPIDAWHVWQVDGSTTEARVAAPTWFPAHCQQALGLRTTLSVRPPLPPPRVQPYPKIGVASSRRLAFQSIETRDTSSPVARALAKSLETIAADDEDREAISYLGSSGWKHPYDNVARRRVPVRVEALYRTPAGAPGVFIHYFEAVKRYAPIGASPAARTPAQGAEPPCEVITVITGWVVARDDDTSVKPSSWRTRMTSCDYESVDVMLPLAYVVLSDQPVWIAQLSGWGRERYVVMNPQAKDDALRMLWATPGGVCASGRSHEP